MNSFAHAEKLLRNQLPDPVLAAYHRILIPPVVSGTVNAPARYSITLLTAIGWHGVLTHFGVIMIGNRSTRYRKISNDAEPAPTIIAGRSTVTGTPV